MSFDLSLIPDAVDRFRRERDRYIKLADRVAEICREEIIEKDVIRAQITSRAKSVNSFKGKLDRFKEREDKNFSDLDDIFQQIGDLSGVRIAAYSSSDCDKIAKLICERFKPPNGEALAPDPKDKNRTDENNFYKAIHCQVALPEEDLIGTYENLSDTTCEIQICSMMAHVWNEVEHDIVYKPAGLEPSYETNRLLRALGSAVRSGDEIISVLLDVADKPAIVKNVGSSIDDIKFADVYDFVSKARSLIGVENFSKNAGLLYDVLLKLELNSLGHLGKLTENNALSNIESEISDFNYMLSNEGSLELDPETSDSLLMLLLKRCSGQIVDLYKGKIGHGKGKANRIYRLAKKYLDHHA